MLIVHIIFCGPKMGYRRKRLRTSGLKRFTGRMGKEYVIGQDNHKGEIKITN